jgi:hypothetical protein
MIRWTYVLTVLTSLAFVGVTAGSARAETYLFEDFEATNAPVPQCWWHAGNLGGKAQLTSEKAFSGKRCALIESGNGNWEIVLPKPLTWDRKNPAGVGNRPLYLSARLCAVGAGAEGHLGFRMSIVPKRHPSFGGAPFEDRTQTVAGRTGEWLLLCFDVGQAMRKAEAEAGGDSSLNPDQVVLQSVSLFTCTDGKYYLDDVRLSNERPEGCSAPPPSPKVDAAAYYRPDPKLEGMVLHGVYGGARSAIIHDTQLHASTVRSMKRHYLNFAFGNAYGVEAPEPQLREVERTLDQAAQYDILFMPQSYISDRYASNEVKAWSDEKLHTEMLKIVRRFKNKTHLLGWYLEEESPVERAAICLKQKRWVEEEDPRHSVWNTFNTSPSTLEFGAAYSVVAADHYPIQGPNPNPWAVPRYLARVVPKFKQPYLLVDQIFAGGGGWTMPTLGQWRLMAYGAMAEGAKGFFHFLYSPDHPLYRMREGERLHGGMVDVYGTPSPIYRETERRLGPDLFSFGELLRTCHPASVPAGIRVECATVEDALERELSAIAVRRLSDTTGGYEILALYSNDPGKAQFGTLHIPPKWLGDRIVMDLSAHSRNILSQTAIQVEGERVAVRLEPGDGRFLAAVTKQQSGELIRRMQARRFEALRKMVEFDCRWLAQVKVGTPYSAQQWADLQQICDEKSPHEALRQVMWLDGANQVLIGKPPLAPVLRDLINARENLSAACDAIDKWAIPKTGQPFPPDVAPGKSYCDVQEKLGELYVGFSDLAYSHTPEALVQPVAELAGLCVQHAEQLKKGADMGVPNEPCRLTLDALKSLEKQLADARL